MSVRSFSHASERKIPNRPRLNLEAFGVGRDSHLNDSSFAERDVLKGLEDAVLVLPEDGVHVESTAATMFLSLRSDSKGRAVTPAKSVGSLMLLALLQTTKVRARPSRPMNSPSSNSTLSRALRLLASRV